MKGRVLIVAGSDSGGGAGIQADIKTVTALGAYASTAVTALTAQDTLGVRDVLAVPPAFVQLQMRMVLDDIGADCIKTGMLNDVQVLDAVCEVLENEGAGIPTVVDPVMVAKGGAPLIADSAIERLRDRLLPLAFIITPNLHEAERILEQPMGQIRDLDGMKEAAARLLAMGPQAVLLKGGHLEGPRLFDVLVTRSALTIFESERLDTIHTHGTGCTLASAIAAGLAAGLFPDRAVARARAYVHEAIRTAPGLGHGHGPLNHCHTVGAFEPDQGDIGGAVTPHSISIGDPTCTRERDRERERDRDRERDRERERERDRDRERDRER